MRKTEKFPSEEFFMLEEIFCEEAEKFTTEPMKKSFLRLFFIIFTMFWKILPHEFMSERVDLEYF